MATANPDTAFISSEVFVNGIASLLAYINDKRLENVLVIPDDMRLFWGRFPDASVAKAFLLFPDPWPKTRHARRRFVNPDNVAQLARILKPGAEFHIASDCAFYIDWTRKVMAEFHRFTLIRAAGVPPEGWVETRYERKALSAERRPFYLTFVKNL